MKNRSKHSLTSSCVGSFSSFRLLSFVSKSGPRARRLMCVSAVEGRQVPLRLVGPLGVAAGKLFPGPHCHRVSYCVERNLRVPTLRPPPLAPLVSSSSDFLPKILPVHVSSPRIGSSIRQKSAVPRRQRPHRRRRDTPPDTAAPTRSLLSSGGAVTS